MKDIIDLLETYKQTKQSKEDTEQFSIAIFDTVKKHLKPEVVPEKKTCPPENKKPATGKKFLLKEIVGPFLIGTMKEKVDLKIVFCDGDTMVGKVIAYDSYAILLESDEVKQIIFKGDIRKIYKLQ